MYVVTNREVRETKSSETAGLEVFGKEPNRRGPNELRAAKVERQGGDWVVEVLKDKMRVSEARELRDEFALDIDPSEVRYASLRVACDLYKQTQDTGRNVVVFVHGYNNDMQDVMDTAEQIEQEHGVICLVFSWPANGGGVVSGTSAYLVDKKDARASMDALNRFFDAFQFFHAKLIDGDRAKLHARAHERFPDPEDRDRAQNLYARLLVDCCETKVSLICHSMGNYLLKYALQPSHGASRDLLFDNVCLAAADANNPGHEQWVQSLDVRNRVYVFINENDFALKWSRRKPGEEQKVRLGHYVKNLIAGNAFYIDVTGARGVGNAHGYFIGDPIKENPRLKELFTSALNGGSPERGDETHLDYHADLNLYRLKRA
jgi:esterase/lipase superfamily enzyme